ncbi:T9SS type A sorting domain-containing protein [Chryseobacterium sp. RJ-7-14]|uniref:T9SS type A sorting domain-containing protein n=2 Tax=Chryseobacterium cheonjiense TaxID=2728845 RepID=A0A7Y0A9G7_9FLAO|nr:T9SS type A sorting domain-containing protein [Chryseobacterium cheonjiense]
MLSISLFAQTTIYSENMGNPSTTTAIAANSFQNAAPILYSGTADVRSTTSSTGYIGASGGGNIFFTGTVGTNFIVSGIDTSSYSNIQMSFGQLKTTNAANNELTVEVSTDGNSWDLLSYTRATGAGTSNYILITPTGTIPSTSNLRIRFTNTSSAQWRIDDLKLTGSIGSLAVNESSKVKGLFVKNTLVDSELNFGMTGNVKIYNLSGQVVKTFSVKENEAVDVSDLLKGNYIVTGLVNGKNISQKIIKK